MQKLTIPSVKNRMNKAESEKNIGCPRKVVRHLSGQNGDYRKGNRKVGVPRCDGYALEDLEGRVCPQGCRFPTPGLFIRVAKEHGYEVVSMKLWNNENHFGYSLDNCG